MGGNVCVCVCVSISSSHPVFQGYASDQPQPLPDLGHRKGLTLRILDPEKSNPFDCRPQKGSDLEQRTGWVLQRGQEECNIEISRILT